jgi:hypothetical protein
MKRRTVLALVTAVTAAAALAACQGFKEAFTAHVDVAAKAGSQELTVEQLAKILSGVQVPVTTDIAKAIANIWVDYQLLGQAAANNDSLNQPKFVDDALWAYLAQERVTKFHDQLVKSYPGVDTIGTEADYKRGDYLAAQHILFSSDDPRQFKSLTPAQREEIHQQALSVRPKVTSANFAQMATQYSKDAGSKVNGGSLHVFPKGQMVKPFQDALVALAPGQISGVVTTEFGYHIIRRNTYAEVKEEFGRATSGPAIRKADSLWMAGLEAAGSIKVLPSAPTTVKNVVTDLDSHTKDKTVLATYIGGDFTVSRLVKWLGAAPQKEQMAEQVRQMPDSSVSLLIKQVLNNELVLRAADSAKVILDSAEMVAIRGRYTAAVVSLWTQLGITPTILADSGKTAAAREKVAASMVDQFLDRLMHQQAQFVPVAPPVESVMRSKFGSKLSSAGLERAADLAKKEKAAADSARVKARPPTEVPIGVAPPAGPASPKPPAPKPPR